MTYFWYEFCDDVTFWIDGTAAFVSSLTSVCIDTLNENYLIKIHKFKLSSTYDLNLPNYKIPNAVDQIDVVLLKLSVTSHLKLQVEDNILSTKLFLQFIIREFLITHHLWYLEVNMNCLSVKLIAWAAEAEWWNKYN